MPVGTAGIDAWARLEWRSGGWRGMRVPRTVSFRHHHRQVVARAGRTSGSVGVDITHDLEQGAAHAGDLRCETSDWRFGVMLDVQRSRQCSATRFVLLDACGDLPAFGWDCRCHIGVGWSHRL
jgi:hypothetical protein